MRLSFTAAVVRAWLVPPGQRRAEFNAIVRVTAGPDGSTDADIRLRPITGNVRFLRQVAPADADLAGREHRYPTGRWGAESREYHLCLTVSVADIINGLLLTRVEVVEAGVERPDVLASVEVRMVSGGAAAGGFSPGGAGLPGGLGGAGAGGQGGMRARRYQEDDEVEHERPSYLDESGMDEWVLGDVKAAPPVIGLDWPAESTPLPPDREAVVNTGFADPDRPAVPLARDHTLGAGRAYLFWLNIGPLSPATIETAPAALPEGLPPDAVITVVLFGFPGELGIDPTAAVGHLRLRPDGTADRVSFPVTAPSSPGAARLRCNLYWRQVLLQSRVVTAHVTETPERRPDALTSTMDYRLADPVDAVRMTELPEHTASLLLNDNGSGTHALRVVAHDGRELLRAETTISEGQLADQIRMARAALRRVAWGSEQPWRPGMPYRYAERPPFQQLADDLVLLAVNGFRLHHLLLRGLGRGAGGSAYDMSDRLAGALGSPGFVQIALKESAQHVLPAALLYDLPLDTNAADLALCKDFVDDLSHGRSLACVRGECGQARRPSPETVCPGGFWGFRHALGLPVSLGGAASVPISLPSRGPMLATGGLYRDFRYVDDHCAVLRELLPGMGWRLTEDRASTLRELGSCEPQVVYFYCHGGVADTVPYLRVGRGTTGPVITPDNLYQARVRWPGSRPLVFLNGCQTTDLDPDRAIDFVSFFVEDALASGVIGTEITVFEELARPFAEDCLRRFLTANTPIGPAVRDARISLLGQGNPLGLAYISFALPAIRIQPADVVRVP